jgi:cation-transporting ATPase 13A2
MWKWLVTRYVKSLLSCTGSGTAADSHQVFDGPISESIPSSVVSFAHRRDRAGSTVSFTYFHDEEDFAEWSNEDAVEEQSELDVESLHGIGDADVESVRGSFVSKRMSTSRDSIERPLLSRYLSASSYGRDRRSGSRLNQKVYIASEDLTAVFAGFSTSTGGYALYIALCILTGGFAYLLFRWLPRWRVKVIGKAMPIGKCQWVAIEVRFPALLECRTMDRLTHDRINGINSPFTKSAANLMGGRFPPSSLIL